MKNEVECLQYCGSFPALFFYENLNHPECLTEQCISIMFIVCEFKLENNFKMELRIALQL